MLFILHKSYIIEENTVHFASESLGVVKNQTETSSRTLDKMIHQVFSLLKQICMIHLPLRNSSRGVIVGCIVKIAAAIQIIGLKRLIHVYNFMHVSNLYELSSSTCTRKVVYGHKCLKDKDCNWCLVNIWIPSASPAKRLATHSKWYISRAVQVTGFLVHRWTEK